MRGFGPRLIVSSLLLFLPAVASAQTSTIAGEVKDTSGAVLPGVIVEVASPALIEKVRAATTDEAGRYSIIQLRPGTYTVTFTLPGFSVVKREGIQLTSDFTATVNADLRVGGIEETITVAAASPIVDVQSMTQRTVMTRETLDAIPTGRNIQAVGIMIPGTNISFGGGGALSRDVGGSGSLQQSPLNYRGSADAVQTVDGMRLNNLCANGAYSGVYWNDGSWQEISFVTGADSAEMPSSGIRINMVPKDGGNTFRGTIVGNYTGENWDANNLRDNLSGDLTYSAANRLTSVSRLRKIWDFNPSVGGPIVTDKLWWQATFRHWGVEKTVPGSFFNALGATSIRYQADPNQQGVDDGHIVSRSGRVTWQASSKDKIAYYHDDQNKYRNHWGISAVVPPEATAIQVTPTSYVSVTRWTRTQSNRLLFDAGFAIYSQEYTELYQPSVTGQSDKVWDEAAINASTVYAIRDTAIGNRLLVAWDAPADHFSTLRTYAGSASYVTGSHSFKFGGTLGEGPRRTVERFTGDWTYIFNNATPAFVVVRTPLDQREGIKADVGIFAQDRWTIKRATINAGVRFDWFQGEVLEEDVPAGRWNPAQHFDVCSDGKNNPAALCVGDVQNWKDLNPRLGIAYDLFGNGRTAVKASLARYVNGEMVGTAAQNNPATTIGRTDQRAWSDNGDFVLQGNPNVQTSNGELGPTTNLNFGRGVPGTVHDPSVLEGWHVRPYNWEFATSVQHQLVPRVALTAGFFRRSYKNQVVADNLLTDSRSYDGPFCVTAPTNPNLPDGGGYQVCGLYDINPAFQGRVQNVRKNAKDFGGITDVYSGFDINLSARLENGTLVQGGIAAMRRRFDQCNAVQASAVPGIAQAILFANNQVDTPENPTTPGGEFCDQTFPFRPDIKLLASHTLPWDVQVSGTYQHSRGVQNPLAPSVLAFWAVPNVTIAPALGRNLAACPQNVPAASCAATKVVSLIQPGTEYGDQNLHQLDLRASKRFRLSRYSFRIDADLYNAFNSNWPFTVNTTFATVAASQWLRPTNVLQSRFFKIGGQFSF